MLTLKKNIRRREATEDVSAHFKNMKKIKEEKTYQSDLDLYH